MDLTMRMGGAAAGETTSPLASARGAWLVVLLLTALGAYLRLANLGELGFRWDEDLTSLAVRAILEQGVPELPSGMIYLRGSWLLYLMAGSAELLGFSELSLRLPAALFGIAIIPLTFVFARALFGTSAGLVAAGLMSISVWDIEISRYARMYAPFAFFYVLTALLAWRYRIERQSAVGGAAAVGAALISISLHQLGYTLALLFLFLPLLSGRPLAANPRQLVWPAGAAAVTAGFFLFWNGFLEHFRNVPLRAGAEAAVAENVTRITERAGATLRDGFASALPDVPFAAALLERAPLLLLVFAVVAALSVGWYLRGRLGAERSAGENRVDVADTLLLSAVALAAVLQLFNVALLAAAWLAYRKRCGLTAIRWTDVRLAAGIIAVGFLAWFAAALALDLTAGGGLRAVVKTLLDYPRFFSFWGFPNEWPLASLLAATGALWAFDRAARRPPHAASLFLLLTLATPLILNGLFETQYELFRYSVPLDAFFFTFVALGILHWSGVLAALAGGVGRRLAPESSRLGAARLAAGTAFAVTLLLAFDFNPLRSFLITERGYSSEPSGGWLAMSRYRDFKSPAEYVLREAKAGDTVVVFETREYYNYLGRLDYWVATGRYETQVYEDGGLLRDLYVGTPLLGSFAALESVLQAPGTKWLIASDAMIAASPTVDDAIRQFLARQEQRAVYVGRDGGTRVYRFDGDPSPLTVSDVVPRQPASRDRDAP